MIKKLVLASLLFVLQSNATDEIKTFALHHEVTTHDNYNVTVETHPTLYTMVKELATKAQVAMPRYITIYDAHYYAVSQSGILEEREHEISAYVDGWGDLYICYQILENASYDEINGILALAIAEKSINKPGKTIAAGAATFAATALLIYLANKHYDLQLGSRFLKELKYDAKYRRNVTLNATIGLLAIPPALTAIFVSNNLQKTIDLKAAQLVGSQDIIDGLKKIVEIKERYFKENILSRIAAKLKLKELFDVLFYPVRSYTVNERVDYLKKEVL